MAAKKRKLPSQSTTLFDFFKQPQGSPKTDPKTAVAKSPAPSKARAQEIIVIDSDDDDEPAARLPTRRRTLSGPAVESQPSSSRVKLGSFGQPQLLVASPVKQEEPVETLASFGEATLLVSHSAPSVAVAESAPEPTKSATASVAEACLAEPSLPVASSTTSGSFFDSLEDPEGQDVDAGAADDNIWALEDDELMTFGPDEEDVDLSLDADGDSPMVDETQTQPGDCTPAPARSDPEECCPLCAISFIDLSQDDVQAHVNACLDKMQPGSSNRSSSCTGGPSKAKPLRPISSLSVPSRPPATNGRHQKRGANAFSMLMSGHKENEAWKEATEAEESTFKGGRRKAPFYKVMQGMPIAVDAFRYGKIPGVTAYFLSHAHSDHYTNLSSSWKHGPIYCSVTTGNLIVHLLGVDRKWVHPLPEDTPTIIPDTGGVEVTVIEANHCPGSSLFLFSGKQTANAGDSTFHSSGVGTDKVFRYLHCGDFRASPRHVMHPAIRGKKLDLIYLDTTYLNAKYCFPPQAQVIEACADLAKQIVEKAATFSGDSGSSAVSGMMDAFVKTQGKGKEKENAGPVTGTSTGKSKMLVVVGTYSIGKERIVKAIAKALNAKVFCDSRKRGILKCQADPELHAMLSTNPKTALVHVVPLQSISVEKMDEYLDKMGGTFDRVLAFRPTGWTYTPPTGTDLSPAISTVLARADGRPFTAASLKPGRGSSARIMLYGVPYSEHSSFFELTAFALSVQWGKMIATVNVGSATSRGKMAKWFEKWDAERRARARTGVEMVPHRTMDYW